MSILTQSIQPLWVPRKRVISPYKHTCPKCGRQWGKRSLWERLRLAMGDNGEVDLDDDGNELIDDDGNLKICGDCCGCYTDRVLIATLNGVDAAMCTACQNPIMDHSSQWTQLTIDGTYEVPFDSLFASTRCWYVGDFPIDGNAAVQEGHVDDTCTNLNVTNTYESIRITLQVLLSDQTHWHVASVQLISTASPYENAVFKVSNLPIIPLDFETPYDNQWTCDYPWPASDGGTIEVAIAP
jgi:hypothetical protein